jgi:hypothetical protein
MRPRPIQELRQLLHKNVCALTITDSYVDTTWQPVTVERRVEIHVNHNGYYFLAGIGQPDATVTPTYAANQGYVHHILAPQYFDQLTRVINGLRATPLKGETYEVWEYTPSSNPKDRHVYARLHLRDLGDHQQALLAFATAYPAYENAAVEVFARH